MGIPKYDTGTVAVTQGDQVVTLTGGTWAEAWAIPGNQLPITGEAQANFIDEWIDTTHVKLVLPVARTTASGLGYSMLLTSPAFGTNRLAALTNIERIRLMSETAGLNSILAVPSAGLVTPALDDRLAGWDHSNADAIVPLLLETLLRAGTRNAAKSATYTVQTAAPNSDFGKLLLVSASGAARTINLPAAATAGDGFVVGVKKTDSSANAVTIDGNGGETIDDAATLALTMQYQTVWLRCDGTAWWVMGDALSADGRDIQLRWTRATAASQAKLVLPENTGNGSNNATLQPPAALGGNRVWTGPDADMTISSYMAGLMSSAGASAARAALGLALGTDVLAYDGRYPSSSGDLVLADDTATSVTAPFTTGVVLIMRTDATSPRGFGFYRYRVTGTAFLQDALVSYSSTPPTVTTGALAGTSGVDGACTIAAHNDGKIYIENRLGASAPYRMRFL